MRQGVMMEKFSIQKIAGSDKRTNHHNAFVGFFVFFSVVAIAFNAFGFIKVLPWYNRETGEKAFLIILLFMIVPTCVAAVLLFIGTYRYLYFRNLFIHSGEYEVKVVSITCRQVERPRHNDSENGYTTDTYWGVEYMIRVDEKELYREVGSFPYTRGQVNKLLGSSFMRLRYNKLQPNDALYYKYKFAVETNKTKERSKNNSKK
jgi:hypothetical protein